MKGRTSVSKSSSKALSKRERFASKFTQRILDEAIENSARKSKDPNLKKLTEKMKSSLLQKVSLGSTVIFLTADSTAHYDQEIAELEKEIGQQIVRLESQAAGKSGQQSSRLSLVTSMPAERGYITGQYENTIQAMQTKVRHISTELADARNSAEERLGSLENTIEVVRDNIDGVLNRQQPKSHTSAASSVQGNNVRRPGSSGNSVSSIGSGGSASKKRSEAVGAKQDPLQSIYNHLQTR